MNLLSQIILIGLFTFLWAASSHGTDNLPANVPLVPQPCRTVFIANGQTFQIGRLTVDNLASMTNALRLADWEHHHDKLQYGTETLQIPNPQTAVLGEPQLISKKWEGSTDDVLANPALAFLPNLVGTALPAEGSEGVTPTRLKNLVGKVLKRIHAEHPSDWGGDSRDVFVYRTVTIPRQSDLDALIGKPILGSSHFRRAEEERVDIFGGVIVRTFTTLHEGRMCGYAIVRTPNVGDVTVELRNSQRDLNTGPSIGFMIYQPTPLSNKGIPPLEQHGVNQIDYGSSTVGIGASEWPSVVRQYQEELRDAVDLKDWTPEKPASPRQLNGWKGRVIAAVEASPSIDKIAHIAGQVIGEPADAHHVWIQEPGKKSLRLIDTHELSEVHFLN